MSSSKKKQLRKEQYLTERQTAEAKEAKQLKRYTLTFWIVIALVVSVFVGSLISSPVKNIIYKNTKAMTVGDYTLSSVEVNYFYIDSMNNYLNQYSSYIQYMIDTTKPLNEQIINAETGATWADNFLDAAKSSIRNTYALYDMAVKNNYTLTEDDQNSINSTIATQQLYATYYGHKDFDSYLRSIYGYGASEKSYRNYLEVSAMAKSYLTAYADSLEFSAEDLVNYQAEEPFKFHSYTFATYLVSVSSFLPERQKDANGKDIPYTDEQQKSAEQAAKTAADLLAGVSYVDLAAFDTAIKNMPINKDKPTASSDKHEAVLYDELATRFQNWLIGKVESEDKDAEPTFELRKEGDITVIPYTTGSGDSEVINGYYVVRFGSSTMNDFAMKNVRHVLVKFEGGKADPTTGLTTYTAEEKSKAKAEAERLLAEWEKGDKSEASFIELAKKNSDDGNAAQGGLYENVYPGQMVEDFEDWCYAAERKTGDYGIVETQYGYHIMFFVGDTEQTFRDFMITNVMRNEQTDEWYAKLVDNMTLTVLTIKHVEMDLVLSH